MKNNFVALMLLFMAYSGFSQGIGYDVFGTQTNPHAGPYFLLTLDSLKEAKTLNDINARYQSSWVSKYISVEVATNCQNNVRKAVSTNDLLTQEQMGLLKMADTGCRIDVEVNYIPKNTLTDNPPKKINFSLTMIPIFEAKYPGGFPQLKEYLRENIIDKIPTTTIEQVALAKVRFNINEEGQVADAHIFKTSEDTEIDKLILEAICGMSKWSPAENSEGKKITQEFEFTMGTALLRCDYQYK